jgi:hypothetical protein
MQTTKLVAAMIPRQIFKIKQSIFPIGASSSGMHRESSLPSSKLSLKSTRTSITAKPIFRNPILLPTMLPIKTMAKAWPAGVSASIKISYNRTR